MLLLCSADGLGLGQAASGQSYGTTVFIVLKQQCIVCVLPHAAYMCHVVDRVVMLCQILTTQSPLCFPTFI